ncbi:MAG: hypothetical protein ABR549_15630 [Mycobacteriales bacterium]
MRHYGDGDDYPWSDAALALTKTPLEAVALAAEHVHDGHGRCRGCVRAGFGRRFDGWPCPLADMAAVALAYLRKQEQLRGAADGAAEDAGSTAS